jgi:ribosomal protein L37AE/L43A
MEISPAPLISSEAAIAFVIAFLIIVECAKEPEYCCENCDKVYKQEARYKAHIGGCIVVGDTIPGAAKVPLVRVVGDTIPVSAEDFSELLRQNREMMTMLRSQQETIQLLVDRLTAGLAAPKMNIE